MGRTGRSPSTPWRLRKTLPLLLACCVGTATGCGPAQQAPAGAATTPPTIEAPVLTVELRDWPRIVRSQGNLIADEVTVVGSKVAGLVLEVHVDLGDLVRAGQPLATLDQSDFRLQVEQAEAQLAQARAAVGLEPDEPVEQLDPRNAPPVQQEQALLDESRGNLDRAEKLRAQNVVTQAEFDQIAAARRVAEARYASAVNAVHEKIALIGVRQAELGLARQRLADAVIRAPFDGAVERRQVAPGEFVQSGAPVATVVRSDVLRFRGSMPERHAQGLQLGQQVVLQIESVETPMTVRVTRISPSLDLRSRALPFEAVVANTDRALRTGLFAEAEVIVDSQAQALVVPRSALVEFAGAEKVWKLVDGTAAEQEVLTGRRRAEGIEILGGLAAGDVILHDGSQGRVAAVKPLPAPVAAAGDAKIADEQGSLPAVPAGLAGGAAALRKKPIAAGGDSQ